MSVLCPPSCAPHVPVPAAGAEPWLGLGAAQLELAAGLEAPRVCTDTQEAAQSKAPLTPRQALPPAPLPYCWSWLREEEGASWECPCQEN